MSIIVVCPSCYKRFQVSEKFAGKTGACPSCKGEIHVPTEDEEVKIEAPGESAAEGAPGSNIVIEPIERLDTKVSPVMAAAIGSAVVVSLLVAWLGGAMFQGNFFLRAVGLLLVSPPLMVAGYALLRESEDLRPFRGKALWLRAAICSVVYAVLWWGFDYVAEQVVTEALWSWALVVPPFFGVGALAALACFDFDYTTGLLHYTFYVMVTTLLGAAAGLGWVWQVSSNATPVGML